MSEAVFVGASALVKPYADEEPADLVRSIATMAVSQLSRVEVPAALWRTHRTGEISADDAARLAGVHGLRAYDAVQLASVLAVGSAGVPSLRFLAFDSALRTAAATEGS